MLRAPLLALLCVGLAIVGASAPAPAAPDRPLEATGVSAAAGIDAPLPLCLRAEGELDAVASILARVGCHGPSRPSEPGTEGPEAPDGSEAGGGPRDRPRRGGGSLPPTPVHDGEEAPGGATSPRPEVDVPPPGEPAAGATVEPQAPPRPCSRACDAATRGPADRADVAVLVAQAQADGLLARLVGVVTTYLALG